MTTFTASEISKNNTPRCLWIIYKGNVCDITDFYPNHPGGSALLKYAGKDITKIMSNVPLHNIAMSKINKVLEERIIGQLKAL
uniref:Cytochrome b5 heme-binding domain-containing protein n=1 Tax=Strongyloides venezuelensis TaxID=75913 RepID=A0A0K0FG29_STRVS